MRKILATLLWLAMMGTASAQTLVHNDGSISNQTNITYSILNFTGISVSVPINVAGMNSCQVLENAGQGSPTGTWSVLGSPDGITYGQVTSPINGSIAGLTYTAGSSVIFPLMPPSLNPAGGLQTQSTRSTGINFIEISFTAFSGTSIPMTVTCSTAVMPPPAANIATGTGALLSGDVCSNSPNSTSANVTSTATLTVNTITLVQALAAGKAVYVCGFSGNVTGTVLLGVQLFSSTSSTCASGNTLIKVVGGFPTSGTQINWDEQGSPIVQTPNAQSLCIEVLGTSSTASQYSFRIIQE